MENEKFFVSLSLFFSFLSHRIDGAATGAATREARAAAEVYHRVLEAIAGRGLKANVSTPLMYVADKLSQVIIWQEP